MIHSLRAASDLRGREAGESDCMFASSDNTPTPGDVRTRYHWLAQYHKPVAVNLG